MSSFSMKWLIAIVLLLCSCSEEQVGVGYFHDIPGQDISNRKKVHVSAIRTDTLKNSLGRIPTIRRTENGTIFVLDKSTERIHVYDKLLNSIAVYGVTGRGPGEFSNITSFDVRDDGTLFIVDYGASRITIIDARGTLYQRTIVDRVKSIGVTSRNALVSSTLSKPFLTVVDDSLNTVDAHHFYQGDPLDVFRYVDGSMDGYSNGVVLSTMYSGLLIVFDSDGIVQRSRRSITSPRIESLDPRVDGALPPDVVFDWLINATDSNIYLTTAGGPTAPVIDVYSTNSLEYVYSFDLLDPDCGPRFIEDDMYVSACADTGDILVSKIAIRE